jgi:hypothetical protein
MRQFLAQVRIGVVNGEVHPLISRFNYEVSWRRLQFLRANPETWQRAANVEERIRRGMNYLRNSGRFTCLLMIPLSWEIADNLGMLDIAANGRGGRHYFRDAVQALSNGDMANAERHLFGGGIGGDTLTGGFYQQLVEAGHYLAAQRFMTRWFEAKRRARELAEATQRALAE